MPAHRSSSAGKQRRASSAGRQQAGFGSSNKRFSSPPTGREESTARGGRVANSPGRRVDTGRHASPGRRPASPGAPRCYDAGSPTGGRKSGGGGGGSEAGLGRAGSPRGRSPLAGRGSMPGVGFAQSKKVGLEQMYAGSGASPKHIHATRPAARSTRSRSPSAASSARPVASPPRVAALYAEKERAAQQQRRSRPNSPLAHGEHHTCMCLEGLC